MRTIRRKLVFGLALVLVMLVALSLSGLSGLRSYGQAVDDLDFSINQMPRRADLVAAIGMLFEPLLLDLPDTDEAARYQLTQFDRQLERTRAEIAEFHRKLEQIPPTPGALARRPVTVSLLAEIERGLGNLLVLEPSLGDRRYRKSTAVTMLNEVAKVQTTAQQLPDPTLGLNQTLRDARSVYRSRLTMVSIASVFVAILFPGLIVCGYRWVFSPIRKLSEGVSRVAQGNLNYRVELTTNDEMSELADAFNDMTARFREIRDDLDRQVQERSKQLVRSERLAGVGFLAAGVAHEINNPLAAIVMATDSLQERVRGSGQWAVSSGQAEGGSCDKYQSNSASDDVQVMRQYLDMIQREAQRCRQITARLLDFSRGQDAARCRNDVADIIREVLALVGHLGKFRDRKIVFHRAEPCFLDINGPEIKQVALNLVANALESMEAGGTLEIAIEEQTDRVVIVFRDDGCGMSAEIIDNLFEPFFTRRKTGKGTGLGLSISHRIVADHGGVIDVSSAGPGQGSTFRVVLPRTAVQQTAA